jgi:hypothetical protein
LFYPFEGTNDVIKVCSGAVVSALGVLKHTGCILALGKVHLFLNGVVDSNENYKMVI